MKQTLIVIALAMTLALFACGPKSDRTVPTGKTIKSVPVGNLTATLSNDSGVLKHGDQDLMLSFADSSGKPIDVGAVSLSFHMPAMAGQ